MTYPSLRKSASAIFSAMTAVLVGVAGLAVVAGTAAARPDDPAPGRDPEAAVRDAGTTDVVPGSYVVVLKSSGALTADAAGMVTGTAQRLTSRYGGAVKRTYSHALTGFEIQATEAQARRLAARPEVAYVQRNGVFRATTAESNPPSWGLDRIDEANLPLDDLYSYPSTAANVHAYILDTGIRFSHNDFGGRAVSGYDAIDGGVADDCNGHGTHVAGTVGGSRYGVAKQVKLVAVRVLDCGASGSTSQVVAGVDWVTGHAIKPAVANMSLGGGADSALDQAVSASIASGVVYSIAAGNGDRSGRPQDACDESPARVGPALTVSATDRFDARASWANLGDCVDIFAPGVGITSVFNSSDGATRVMSGTSMAAPHVTGAAALVLANHPDYTPSQVRAALMSRATNGAVQRPGGGSPNVLLRVPDAADEPVPTPNPTVPPVPTPTVPPVPAPTVPPVPTPTVPTPGQPTAGPTLPTLPIPSVPIPSFPIPGTPRPTPTPTTPPADPTTPPAEPGPAPTGFRAALSPAAGPVFAGSSLGVTLSTTALVQPATVLTMSVGDLPAGVDANVGPALVLAGGNATLTLSTTTGAVPGRYPIAVTVSSATESARLVFTLTVLSTQTGGACSASNASPQPIADLGPAVSSPVTLTGCPATASYAEATVHIRHAYRGDLVIDLIAPDGTTRAVKSASWSDGADNVDITYQIDVTGLDTNGTWTLRVRDALVGDAGTLTGWSLALVR